VDVIARAEPQQRRRAMLEMRQHELTGRAVIQRHGGSRPWIDELGMSTTASA
jgi:hypothetical protein